VKYPEYNALRDDDLGEYVYDWRGDHPYTNYIELYEYLIHLGYFVDILNCEWGCIDASNYFALLLIDTEIKLTDYE